MSTKDKFLGTGKRWKKGTNYYLYWMRYRNLIRNFWRIIRRCHVVIRRWQRTILPPLIGSKAIKTAFPEELGSCFTSKSGNKWKFLQHLNWKIPGRIVMLLPPAILLEITGAFIWLALLLISTRVGFINRRRNTCNGNSPRKLQGRQSSLYKVKESS